MIESEIRKHYWRSFKTSRPVLGMTLSRLTSSGFISTLIMNEYGLLLEKHHPIEIQSPKFVLTIVWGVAVVHGIKLLRKGDTFNACYYIDEILSEITSWREGQ
jgi:hypothetical protein